MRWVLLAALVGVAALAAWLLLRPPAVEVAEARRGPVVETVYAAGTVEAHPRVEVRARAGGTAEAIRADEGDAVQAGELLLVVENDELREERRRAQVDLELARARASDDSPRLAEAEAGRRAAEAALAEAERDLAAAERLAAAGAAPRREAEAARTARDRARAERDAAAERVRALQVELLADRRRQQAVRGIAEAALEGTEVRAPIDGVVIRRLVEPGELVAAGQPVFVVGDAANLVLELRVDEADVAAVRVGQPAAATIHGFDDRAVRGRVAHLAPDADRDTRTFLAQIELDAPPAGLRSGMTAEANVVVAEAADALVVPAAAVRGDRVWVVEDGRARERVVEVGVRGAGWIEIRRGLEAGERVIVGGPRPEEDGARVRAR